MQTCAYEHTGCYGAQQGAIEFVTLPLAAYGSASSKLHKGSLQQARQTPGLERGAPAKTRTLCTHKTRNTLGVCLQALRQRKEGPSLPLKELHNDVKRQLIYRQGVFLSVLLCACRASADQECFSRFAGSADSLLDLACGRGGDIWKWTDAQVRAVYCSSLCMISADYRYCMQIKYIKGIDLSPSEVEEARRRFQEMKARKRKFSQGQFCWSNGQS